MSRPEAEHQLQRVLAMIPWLASRPGVHKDEVAARFRITRDELERDLGLIMMVGVPPYTPGDYINVYAEGDTVELWLADYFTRPLQLSPSEGLALLAGGRALLAVEGSDPEGPLATALVKLEDALGMSEVVVEFGAPAELAELRRAASAGERVEIDYWSAGRDEVTTRRIDPGPPFFALGRWYSDAYCHLRDEQRMFRVDRIRALRATGERFDPDAAPVPEVLYAPRPGDPRVTLELPAGASWVAESFPAESVEDLPGGGQRVVVAVSEPAWLDRILLRVGTGARVVDPPELRAAGRLAALRVLARYRT
ncbi:MAG: WYL domain-containing protein [Actinobacteria bacterium]|nr:WYL domain-containing protein [Actinomycetota bacterium]